MRSSRLLLCGLALLAPACGSDVAVIVGGGSAEGGGGGGQGGSPPGVVVSSPDLDLLIVVDSSIGMAPKQEQFAAQIGRLVEHLVSPPCFDPTGGIVARAGDGSCPSGSTAQFEPVRSLHLGVISSSLGDLTSGACSGSTNVDDKGRLLSRGPGGPVETYQDLGFLAYDAASDSSTADLIAKTQEIILGVDEVGCGYEMPLEAMTRFLVDPDPYEAVAKSGSQLALQGTDQVVLQQRAAFLRPTSSLAIIVLSDENDCSIDVGSQGFLVLAPSPFYRATAQCEVDPNDTCCNSCALVDLTACAPTGCESSDDKYTAPQDQPNLKCWEQKRRYGVDFQFPVQRYVNALTLTQIAPAEASLSGDDAVVNPLFAGGRDPSQVTFMTIGGVPWQDLVTDPSDATSRYRTADELSAAGAWDWISAPSPTDPFMHELDRQRSGNSPTTGESVSAPNGINGGDRTIPEHNWLEYACITPLDIPISDSFQCDECGTGPCDNPICDGATQLFAGANPTLRQNAVARGMGTRGVVASMCRGPGEHTAMDALAMHLGPVLD